MSASSCPCLRIVFTVSSQLFAYAMCAHYLPRYFRSYCPTSCATTAHYHRTLFLHACLPRHFRMPCSHIGVCIVFVQTLLLHSVYACYFRMPISYMFYVRYVRKQLSKTILGCSCRILLSHAIFARYFRMLLSHAMFACSFAYYSPSDTFPS